MFAITEKVIRRNGGNGDRAITEKSGVSIQTMTSQTVSGATIPPTSTKCI